MSAIAVAQFAPGAVRDENLAIIRDLVATAVQRGAGLVLLPEYASYFTPEMGPDWIAAADVKRAVLTNLHIDMDYNILCSIVPQNVEVGFDGWRAELAL